MLQSTRKETSVETPPQDVHPETNRLKITYRKLSSEILDLAHQSSCLPPMKNNASDPFYRAFTMPFLLPQFCQGMSQHLPLSHYVKMAWDKALPPAGFNQHLRTREDTFQLVFAWLAKIREDKEWQQSDTVALLGWLDTIKAALKKAVFPLLAICPSLNASLSFVPNPSSITAKTETPRN